MHHIRMNALTVFQVRVSLPFDTTTKIHDQSCCQPEGTDNTRCEDRHQEADPTGIRESAVNNVKRAWSRQPAHTVKRRRERRLQFQIEYNGPMMTESPLNDS